MIIKSLHVAITFSLLAHANRSASDFEQRILFDPTVCAQISGDTSSATSVYYPGDSRYDADMSHWASSNSQAAKCSVRPGTAADVGIILRIVGSTRTPFAVKGGGHAANPGFSSTAGVLIAMSRFSEVTYSAASQTVVIGAGLIWDDVYAALGPHNANVVGARSPGVGVAGFSLGGGYSWLTNQYGLTVDTVTAFELVKPNGAVVTVTQASKPDLFFGLKARLLDPGGLNNFGIVTRFTLKTFPQGQVWGGPIAYASPQIPDVLAATANFSAFVIDPKASLIASSSFYLGQPSISQMLFYDGPTPPAGIFDDFLVIPHVMKDVSTRDFLSLIKSSSANATYGQRAIFNTVSLTQYTPTLLDTIFNETVFWGNHLSLKNGTYLSYSIEPFLPSLFSHTTSSSAYPPSRGTGLSPFNINYAWGVERFDNDFYDAARQSATHITNSAIAEGQDIADAAVYPNYAIFDTPLTVLYGANVPRLQALKVEVDPRNVMGLAGGFKF